MYLICGGHPESMVFGPLFVKMSKHRSGERGYFKDRGSIVDVE